ncbi:putative SPARK domain-containing protein [Helianthus anomalus]
MNYWLLLLLLPLFSSLPLLPALPNTDPVQSFHPNPTPPATTIPAFPEQSEDSGCPLDLPNDLFKNVKSACTGKHASGQLRRSRCCPVLAAWLYSAYSATALGKTIKQPQQTASYYDLPLLPNDSETCIDSLENRLKSNGIELTRVNESCDVVYCECGIRLHQLSCPEAFSVNSGGDLIGNHAVQRLEKDCLNNVAVNGFPGLDGCSKCLKTLHLLNKGDTNKSEERSSKMHNKDCELMGLTWLLAKNRSAYIRTVSAVLRATMMNTDGDSIPESCTLNSDGMPLAVDSYEINGSPSLSTLFLSSLTVSLALLLLYVSGYQLFFSM